MSSRKRLQQLQALREAKKLKQFHADDEMISNINVGVQTVVTTSDKDIQVPELEPTDTTTVVSVGSSESCDTTDTTTVVSVVSQLSEVAQQAGYSLDSDSITSFVSSGSISLQSVGTFHIHNSSCSRTQYYPVITFLQNGYLHADYLRLCGSLGLPSCCNTQWHRIITKLEVHVTKLAEWSCGQVQKQIVSRGDDKKWIASYDGFYLTRGHYSNNSSATLHDYQTGRIAWFSHRTKRGPGHNWEGTSGGAECDTFNEILGKVKAAGFTLREVITDKDSSMNSIFCRHFPEGTITYCSNHCAKTLHTNLQKIKQRKCECRAIGFKGKRMTDSFLTSCKTALSKLIASDKVQGNEKAFTNFSEALLNFHDYYCLDIHVSPWCTHDKLMEDGSPYKSKHRFSCQAQVDGFKTLLDEMAAYPQDYVWRPWEVDHKRSGRFSWIGSYLQRQKD